jgi:glycosyltransferase involved in cell wall biosynthesis
MMTQKPAFLSFVFSFRNEAEVLPGFIKSLRTVLLDLRNTHKITNWELIFVNDHSTDRSLETLIDLDADHKDIKIITMSRTFGVSECVMAGLAQTKGDAVIYMDCDLQDPPELIPQMLNAWYEGKDVEVVHTIRKKRYGESPFKLLITKIGYYILNRYSSVEIPREAGDFKLLSRRMVDHLVKMQEIRPFIRGLVAYIGFKQVFVEYERQARFAGKSKFFVLSRKVISNFLNSALINFSSVPLQIASYCGILAFFIDLLLIIYALYEKICNVALPGWTALMIVILFVGGIQLFCLGTIGLYLHSVHEQAKMRPQYIVSSTYGFENG